MMDPNRTLDELRKQAKNSGETWSYMFEALDGWIMAGGFLPEDWRSAPSTHQNLMRKVKGVTGQ